MQILTAFSKTVSASPVKMPKIMRKKDKHSKKIVTYFFIFRPFVKRICHRETTQLSWRSTAQKLNTDEHRENRFSQIRDAETSSA